MHDVEDIETCVSLQGIQEVTIAPGKLFDAIRDVDLYPGLALEGM